MAVRTRRVAAATYLPLTVQDCKDHMRITLADAGQDALIATYLSAAVAEVELLCQRTLCETTWIATFDDFPSAIKLPMAPVLAVTSVQYLDLNGILQTLDANEYALDSVSEPAFVVPAPAATWPTTQVGAVNSVKVTYRAGYKSAPATQAEAAAAVPAPIRAYLLIRMATLFENRENISFASVPQVVPTLAALLDPYKIIEV
jgi:uncharacterized phiE125 gp8 family phage protein